MQVIDQFVADFASAVWGLPLLILLIGGGLYLLIRSKFIAFRYLKHAESIAYLAADLSLRHGLAMADAIVYATAKDQDAQVVTGDADLKDLPGVIYVK